MSIQDYNSFMLMEAMPDAFAYLQLVNDEQGNLIDCTFIYVNSAFEAVIGLNRKEIMNQNASKLLGKSFSLNYEQLTAITQFSLSTKTAKFNYYINRIDKWFEITAYTSDPGYLCIILGDITLSKEAVIKLQEAHNRLLTVMDSIDAVIYVADIETHEVLFVNQQAYQLWGDIRGKKCWQVLQSGYSAPCHWCTNEKLVDTHGKPKGIFYWEDKQFSKGGWYHSSERAIKWIDGRTVRIEVAHDITERKQIEAEHLKQKAQFKSLFVNTNDAMVYYDIDFKIYNINSQYTNLFGYTLEDVLGKDVIEVVEPTRISGKEITAKIIQGEAIQLETVRYHKSGKAIPVQLKGGPVFIDGVVTGGYAIYSDITERKETEAKISNYTMEIELKSIELETLYAELASEVNKAKKIHEQNLPLALPEVKGLRLSAYYQPAQKMGGDYYDVIRAGDKLVFYVSDVSGHELDGAMLSVFISNTISSYLALVDDANVVPIKIIQHLFSQYTRHNYPPDYFVCVFICVLDLNTRELSYFGCGFQHPCLCYIDGARQELTGGGLPISNAYGIELLDMVEKKIIFSPGSTIILFTDGLVEEEQAGDQYGLARLDQVIVKNITKPPVQINAAIKADYQNFIGEQYSSDDITYLILQS